MQDWLMVCGDDGAQPDTGWVSSQEVQTVLSPGFSPRLVLLPPGCAITYSAYVFLSRW